MTFLLFFKWFRRAIALLLLLVVLVVLGTAARVWQVARSDNHPHSDAIVVLGASQFNGRPSAVFEARLRHAKALYDQGVAPRVVTVGGKRTGDRFSEAAAGARFLTGQGVPTKNLVAVEQGNDTLSSLRAMDPVFEQNHWRSAVVVTDPWHSLRSRRMTQDLGITASTSPARSGPAVRSRSTEWRYIARETAAYLYYRLFHRSSDSGPRAV